MTLRCPSATPGSPTSRRFAVANPLLPPSGGLPWLLAAFRLPIRPHESRPTDHESRVSTRNTPRPGIPVSDRKQSYLIFLPETPPHCSAFRACESRCLLRRVGPARVTNHESRVTLVLIVNMIIRIAPKSFVFSANSISNRQYLRGLTKLPISRPTSPWFSLATSHLPLATSSFHPDRSTSRRCQVHVR
jgi:hypothetical protein